MSPSSTDPMLGRTLHERYRLDALIAYGGMSRIYRAIDKRLHRSVAVKILNENFASDPVVRTRFESEAVIAANIVHPNVVSIRDHNVTGNLVYLVMEYVRGQNLHELISARGRLTPRQTLSVLEHICRGLAAAHGEGIVHRDMKPGNVLIADSGEVKVTDFGLARATSNHTQSASLHATFSHVSPEQVSGFPADARSDIYAVGIMIYEMLTGQRPYTGQDAAALIRQHLDAQMPMPSALVPELAQDLDELVRFCTEKDPENRPQDAGFLLDEVIQIRATLSDTALDLGSETYGQVADLTPHATSLPTTVQQRLDEWEREREAQRDPWWTEPGTGQEPGNAASTRRRHDTEDATSVLDAAAAPTEVVGRDEAANTEVYSPAAPDPDTDPLVAPANATLAMPRAGLRGGTGAGSVPSPAPGAAVSAREQKRAQKQWRKLAQVPTHRLAPRKSATQKVLITLSLVLLVVLVAGLAWFFGRGPGTIVRIPALSGMLQAQAIAQLDEQGVPVRVNNGYNDEVAVGRVVSSTPDQGSNIMRFQGVELLVSRGPESFTLPDVAGLSPKAATDKLAQLQLSNVSSSEEYSPTIEKGTVLGTSPSAGAQVTRKSSVDVVVSAGPAPVAVPALVGLDEAAARAAVQQLGLELELGDPVHSAQLEAGLVAVQDPKDGTVPAGSTLTVQLSQGPEYVQIPTVMGQGKEAAIATLEQAGFVVETKNMLGGRLDTVRMQTPLNQRAERGATITLYIF